MSNPSLKLLHPLLCIMLITLQFAFLALPRQAHAQSDLTDLADLETFLDGVMAAHLESYNIPGATLSLVYQGETLFAKGYGYTDLEALTEVNAANTLFRPGSVSKLFTWTAIMQLVEQGQLDLHTDVNEYLDFTIPATYDEPITLAHLMTHTPGFADVSGDLFVLTPEAMLPLDEYLKTHLPQRVYPPGEVGAYSNYGTALAGYIVERVAGQPFAEYVEEQIFAPLGMTQSTFRQPLPPELAEQLASGYGFYNGTYVRGGFEYVTPYPAGSLSTTATDMAAFMLAHLNEGQVGDATILQPETIAEMHSHQFSVDPRLQGMTYGFMEDQLNERRVLLHGGDTFLFHSALFLVPEEELGLFVSYNGAGGTQARAALLRALIDRYFPVPPLPLETPANAAQVAQYSGEYHPARSEYSSAAKILRMLQPAQVSVTPEGMLLVSVLGQVDPYVEVEPGLFRHVLRHDLLLFQRDDNGTTWLVRDGEAPFTYFQPPWYATFSVTMLLLVVTLLLFIGSIIAWLIGAFSIWGRSLPPSRLRPVARWTAALFGLLLVIFLVAFISVFGEIDPAYGVPRIFFGDTPTLRAISWLPIALAVLAVGLIIFMLAGWARLFKEGRRDWSLAGQLHYTLLTGLALAVLASFWYWNLLAIPS